MKLAGKVFLVTGATGGIGVKLCHLLGNEGVNLLVTASQQQVVQQLAQELGTGHRCVSADLSSAHGRQQVIQACQQAGGIDGVVNLAGTLDFGVFSEQSTDQIERMITTNFLAPILLTHALIPQLAHRSEAIVLNVGSVFGSIGHPGFVAYCAAKAGVKGFTEALSRELADSSIRVCYIAPRATSTAMNDERVTAMNQVLGNKSDSPEFVAREIVKQLRSGQQARYLGWPEKLFVRINALLPGIVNRAVIKNLGIIKKFALQGSIS